MDAVSQMLDGGTVFGNFGPETGDMPPDDGESRQDKGHNTPLEIFHTNIETLRTIYIEQNDIDSIGQQDKKTNIYKTAGIETVDTEEKDENVSHQKDATGLMGKIHSKHYNKDGDTHLDGRQAGIGHFQIHTRAEEYIQKNVNNENADERYGNGLPFR
jgi:hypothetical protein